MSDPFSPLEWQERRLIELAHYINGYAFKPIDWSPDGTRIIRIEQLNNPEGYYDHFEGIISETNAIDNGDLIFSWSATLKVAIWKHGKGVLNQHLFKVVPKDGYDKRFIYHILGFNMDALGGGSHGSTMKHIKRGELERYTIRVPLLHEQQLIAEILATVDEAIEQTEALIAKTQQIKAGLMHDLFTRGVTKDGQLRPPREEAPYLYKESPLGWIPKEWDADLSGKLATSIVPGRNKPLLDGGAYPWITITDFLGSRIDQSREQLSVSASSLLKAGGRIIPAGAVVMSCVGEFGIAAVSAREIVVNQQLHAFVTEDRIQPDWMMYSLRRQKPFLERIATQTTIKYLNKARCESNAVDLRLFRLPESVNRLKLQFINFFHSVIIGADA